MDCLRYIHSAWGSAVAPLACFWALKCKSYKGLTPFPRLLSPTLSVCLSDPLSISHLSNTRQTELLVIGTQCHSKFIIITVRKAKA